MLSHISHIQLFATVWTITHQSMGFSRQEYWSGLPCPPPWDLPDPGIDPTSLKSSALAGGLFTTATTWETQRNPRELKLISMNLCITGLGFTDWTSPQWLLGSTSPPTANGRG